MAGEGNMDSRVSGASEASWTNKQTSESKCFYSVECCEKYHHRNENYLAFRFCFHTAELLPEGQWGKFLDKKYNHEEQCPPSSKTFLRLYKIRHHITDPNLLIISKQTKS